MAIPILRQSPQTVGELAHKRLETCGYKTLVVVLDGKRLVTVGDKGINQLIMAALNAREDVNGAEKL